MTTTGQDSKFQNCTFYDHLHDCGPSIKAKSSDVFSIDQLKSNVTVGLDYVSELDLIVSRCGVSNAEVTDIREICEKHRYKFGIYYQPSHFCQHPNCINKSASSESPSLNLSRYISTKHRYKFPIILQESICRICRRQEEEAMKNTESELGGVSPMEEEEQDEVAKALACYKKRPTNLYNFRNIKNPDF
ncbi:unnamed protein product, partial [Didymodactylos carnosus]